MQADGTILIDSKIKTDGFVSGSRELEAAARRMASSVRGLGEKAETALRKQTDSFVKLNGQYAEQERKVERLRQKVAEYGNQKMPTQEYREVSAQISAAQSRLDGLIQRQQKFLDTGGKTGGRAYKSMQYDIEELRNTIRYAEAELRELEATGNAYTSGAGSAAAQKDMDALAREEAKLDDMNNRLATSFASLRRKVEDYGNAAAGASGPTKDVGENLEKVGETAERSGKSLGGAFKTIIKYSLGIRSMLALVNRIRSAVAEGMRNLVQYSSGTNAAVSMLSSSLTRLKNAAATAAAPLLEAVAPALSYIADLAARAATAIAQFLAALTGKKTFVKAVKVQEDYAKSLAGTGEAAKEAGEEAEGSLAPFDKLNVMAKENADSGAGGGGGGVSPGTEEMFETVEVDPAILDAVDKIKQRLDELKQRLGELKGLFQEGFWDGLGDTSVFDSIRDNLARIRDSLAGIFTDPAVLDAASRMMDTIAYNMGRIAGAFSSVGLTIADNLTGGLALYLEQNTERIKQYLIDMFDITGDISTIVANFAVAVADVFSVFRGDTAKQATADIIAIFTNAFMGITELAYKAARDVLDMLLTPFVENADKIKEAVNNTLTPIEEVLRTIADSVGETFDKLNQMYDEHLKPLFDSIRDGVSEVLGTFIDGYNEYLAPVLQKLADKFSVVWKDTIQPLIDDFIDLVGDVADLVKNLWEQVFQPFLNWFAENIMPVISPIVEGIGTLFLDVFQGIGEVLDVFVEALDTVVEFLNTGFEEGWDKAWDDLKEKFSGVWESLPDVVKGAANKVLSALESMVNNAIRALNGLISGANGILSKVPGLSLEIPTIREVSLPRLAEGTVVPPRAGEFAAVLGDNKREPEVVSPLSTMVRAFREALAEADTGGGDITARIYLDGRELGRSVADFVRDEKKRTGVNPVLF